MKHARLFFLLLVMICLIPFISVADDVPVRSARTVDPGGTETSPHDNYVTWSHLPCPQKESLKKHYADFSRLPKDKKAHVRSHYSYWKNISEDRRQDLRERFKKWQNMPEPERARLRERGAGKAGPNGRLAGRNEHP